VTLTQGADDLIVAGKDGRGLRVRFDRHADRFQHSIDFLDGNSACPWLTSDDECGTDPWPKSPPLQQGSVEDRGSARVALFLCMAGRGHWSLSIETRPELVALDFDVACRVPATPQWLGSRYRLVAAENPPPCCNVQILDDNGDCTIARSADALSIVWTGASQGDAAGRNWPATIRWRYRIAVA